MPLRARGNSRLAHQQRAEILKADRVGQQREDQRAKPIDTVFAVDAYAPSTASRDATHALAHDHADIDDNRSDHAHAGRRMATMRPVFLWTD